MKFINKTDVVLFYTLCYKMLNMKKFLSHNDKCIVDIKLIKNITIIDYKNDYRYIDDDMYHIVFNLKYGDCVNWKFDDKDTMLDIFKKVKKQLLTIEIV